MACCWIFYSSADSGLLASKDVEFLAAAAVAVPRQPSPGAKDAQLSYRVRLVTVRDASAQDGGHLDRMKPAGAS
ncbi:MAG: hypothetical protein WD273_02950 [Trueperaceae bacterium]